MQNPQKWTVHAHLVRQSNYPIVPDGQPGASNNFSLTSSTPPLAALRHSWQEKKIKTSKAADCRCLLLHSFSRFISTPFF